VQLGQPDEEEKPKNASLLKGMRPEDITVDTALALLSLPRELGIHPQTSQKITAYNGRFGPYVKSGEETRSLPSDLSPLAVTFEQAVELLAQPKKQRRGFGAPKEPLKILGTSPVTKQDVKLLEGRYGPYVSDGVTNASLPKQQPVEETTLEQALALLAARAAAAPVERPGARGRGARKAPARKAPAGNAISAKPPRKRAAKKKASSKPA
jgi:DNA topoisomerase-1